jgi:hypothetical protein
MTDEERTKLRADARAKMMANPGNGIPSVTPRGTPARAAAPKAKPGKPAGDAGRWATLNAFVDIIAPHLTLAEQAVWVRLYRWCREGKVSASTRQIAAGCGITAKTATAAVKGLRDVGLVWVVSLSHHKGTASVYGLHPHPDRCLGKCMEARPRQPR